MTNNNKHNNLNLLRCYDSMIFSLFTTFSFVSSSPLLLFRSFFVSALFLSVVVVVVNKKNHRILFVIIQTIIINNHPLQAYNTSYSLHERSYANQVKRNVF